MHAHPIVAVVEDDEGVRTSLGLLMANTNYSVKTYETAEAFLTCHLDDPPHCLLLDVDLPGMSGLDLLQDLATHSIRFPVIMMSGSLDPFTPIRAERLGAIDFFEKPFNAYVLLDRVQQALEFGSPALANCHPSI
jgi:FixJ family two-component response regulator